MGKTQISSSSRWAGRLAVGLALLLALTLAAGPASALIACPGGCCQDAWEPLDNLPGTTTNTLALDAGAQNHTFCPIGDLDWMNVTVTTGGSYVFETLNLVNGSSGQTADTVLVLYEADGTTVINWDDDNGGEPGASRFTASLIPGNYKLLAWDWNKVGGRYDVRAYCAASIYGQITDAESNALGGFDATDSVLVYAFDTAGHLLAPPAAATAGGNYAITGLPLGDVKLWFNPKYYNFAQVPETYFAAQWYADAPNINAAQTITLSNSCTPQGPFDAALEVGGVILGYVTNSDGEGLGVTAPPDSPGGFLGVLVTVYDENCNLVGMDITDENGFYAVFNLAPGLYKIHFDPTGFNDFVDATYLPEWNFNRCLCAAADLEQVTLTEYLQINAELNRAPIANSYGLSASENVIVSVGPVASDPDGDTVTCSTDTASLPDGATFTDCTFSWTPTYCQAGTYVITYQACDSNTLNAGATTFTCSDQNCSTGAITVTIYDVPQTPTFEYISVPTFTEGVSSSFTISVDNPGCDDLQLIYSGTLPCGPPTIFKTSEDVDVDATWTFVWTPNYCSAPSSYTATFSISGGTSISASTVVTIAVSDVLQAPVLTNPSSPLTIVGTENSLISFTAAATDEGINTSGCGTGFPCETITFTWECPVDVAFSTQGANNETFVWTPGWDQMGTYTCTIHVCDSQSQCDTETMTLSIQEGPNLQGTVSDCTSGAPLNAIDVTLGGGPTSGSDTTATDGVYFFQPVLAGTYTITFSPVDVASNYLEKIDTGVIYPADGYVVHNTCLTQGGCVSGNVTDGTDPVSGLTVEVLDPTTAAVIATGTTDGSGNYTINQVPVGTYKVKFSGAGFLDEYYDQQITFADANTLEVVAGTTCTTANATVVEAASVCGTVYDDQAVPAGLEGVTVWLINTDDGSRTSLLTDSDGEYCFNNIRPPGNYKVWFDPTQYDLDNTASFASQWFDDEISYEDADTITLTSGLNATADAYLDATGGNKDGHVYDSCGVGIEGIDVSVYNGDDNSLAGFATTDADGYYAVFVPGDCLTCEGIPYKVGFVDPLGTYLPVYNVLKSSLGMTGTQDIVLVYEGVNTVVDATMNQLPSFLSFDPQPKEVYHGQTFTFNLADYAVDPDCNQTLSFEFVGDPGLPGTFSLTDDGLFSWTPPCSATGSTFVVTFLVHDNVVYDDGTTYTGSATQTLTLLVLNHQPTISSPDWIEQDYNSLISFTVTADDLDLPNDDLTVSVQPVSLPSGASFNTESGIFNWTPSCDQVRPTPYVFTFTVLDCAGATSTSVTSILVTNSAPSFTDGVPDERWVDHGETLTVTPTVYDPNQPSGLVITVQKPSDASNASFDGTTFTWTPTCSQVRSTPYVFTFRVVDCPGASQTQLLTVHVTDSAPTFTNEIGTVEGYTGDPIAFTLQASDPNIPSDPQETITFTSSSLPEGATLDGASGAFAWTPDFDQSGTFTVTFFVTDHCGGLSDSQVVTFVIEKKLLFQDTFCDDNEDNWTVVQGAFKFGDCRLMSVHNTAAPSSKAVVDLETGGLLKLGAGRIESRIKLTTLTSGGRLPNASLLYGLVGPLNYRYVKFEKGKITVAKVELGVTTKSVFKKLPIPVGKWFDVRVDLKPDGLAEIYVNGRKLATYQYEAVVKAGVGVKASRARSFWTNYKIWNEEVFNPSF